MSWRFSKSKLKPSIRCEFGTLFFDGTGWSTAPDERSLHLFTVNVEFDSRAIQLLADLLKSIDALKSAALSYIATHGNPVWDGSSELVLESVDFTDILQGGFGLGFGTEAQPDFTVHVEFVNGQPSEVWAAD